MTAALASRRLDLAALALAAAVLPLVCGGCATIFSGTSDTLTFDSNVPNTRLSVDGKLIGQLPLSVDMSRNFVGGQQFIAHFEADGYKSQEFKLDRVFNGVAVLDITSVVTSGGIDVLTGALMKFSPRDYHVQMQASDKSAESPEYRRSLEGTRFALLNYRALCSDLARGGGEYLTAFAHVVSDGDAAAARRIQEASLGRASYLATSPGPRDLLARFNETISERPELRPYAL
jgi:hypothetical protein